VRILSYAVVLLGLANVAAAASRLTDVTPANVAKQPLTLRVEHESYENGIVRFEVFVSDDREVVSPHREGRFVVWQEEVEAREDATRGPSTRPPVRTACRVEEEMIERGLCYQVQVHRELIGRVTFTFFNYDADGMPAFNGYELLLGEFAED